MKLLIELDEEYVKVIDKIEFLVGGRTDRKLQLAIIKAIKNSTPLEQEPFINKTCVSSEVCEYDKNVVINKIRAEIAELDNKVCQQFLIEDVDKEVHHAYQDCLGIIDKYKRESEGQ